MECPHCGKRITRAARLREHIAAVHEGRRDHECPHCQKRFGFARGLQEHVRLAHENVRPHSCGLCGQSFHKAADLRAHAAIHERRGFVHRSGREALVERLLRREELPFQRQLRVDFTDGSSHGGHALLDFALERDWGLIALEVDEGQHLEGRWVVNYMYNLLSKYGCCNTYLSRHIFRLSCFSNTELKHIVCELSRCTLSCISVLTCILGRGILLKKGSARPGSRVYSRKISSKKFVQQDIMCL